MVSLMVSNSSPTISSSGSRDRGRLTGVGHGDRLGVDVTESAADRGKGDERDGTGCTDDNGPEDGGLLVGGPAQVAEGSRPELRGRHGERAESNDGSSEDFRETGS